MADRTIEDFGEQWTRYRINRGYYASGDLLKDILEPLLPVASLEGRMVLEIGSGTGRILNMLLNAGVARVIAVEPSVAMEVLKENTRDRAARVTYFKTTGEAIPEVHADCVICIGVLHHIADPVPTVRRAAAILEPGGRFLFWVYGREGNELYLRLVQPLRMITRHMPDALLDALCSVLNWILTVYIALCRHLPLPLHKYVREVLSRCDPETRKLTIFDQLNPSVARYYTRGEAVALMQSGGFENIRVHHRHGYSWTVVGEKAAGTPAMPGEGLIHSATGVAVGRQSSR